MFDHPAATTVWKTVEIDADGLKTVLVIETTVKLDATAEAFDAGLADDLLDAAQEYFQEHSNQIDRIRFVTLPGG